MGVRETRKIQIKLSKICNKNERYQVAKIMLNCRSNGRRSLGRHLKRQLGEAKTNLLISKTTINLFQSNKTIFYLPYWLPVSAIRSSSGHPYIKFKTGYMYRTLNSMSYGIPYSLTYSMEQSPS